MREAVAAVFAICVLVLMSRQAPAAGDPVAWADIAEHALPAVVNITVEKIVSNNGGLGQRETFFGSGFVIDPAGAIVTNKHVIDGAIGIMVTFADRSTAPAQLLAAAGLTDLAALKVDMGRPLPFLKFANSDGLRIGEPVLAIGNPLGLGMSVSAGIVSALNRDIMDSPFDENIQTDASINHGNSGGPLLNRAGEVIGVNTALTATSPSGGSIGIGYAIPSNEANLVIHWIVQANPRPPGWIGVHLQDVTPDIAQVFGLGEPRGFIVTGFDANSPAQAAGMQAGDILLRFGALQPVDARAMLRGVVVLPVDQSFRADIWRDGKQITLEVQVKPWPNLKVGRGTILANTTSAEQAGWVSLGVSLGNVTDDVRRKYALKNEGATVTAVARQSEAYDRGITPGDIILRVNKDPVVAPEQAMGVIDEARAQGKIVALLVQDPSGSRWITLNLGREHAREETPKVSAQAGGERAPPMRAATGATHP
jgi:serine protease Do